MLTDIPTLDQVLQSHAAEIGNDFTGYRNHTYRVVNICMAQIRPDPESIEKIAIAAAFHDLGIWTDRTFDYLPPSIRLATAYLAGAGRAHWSAEITAMILEHHRLRPYHDGGLLVEPFRRADWIDVCRGAVAFGVSRSLLHDLYAQWPSAGFHTRLVQLSLTRLATHPWNPLPMIRP